MKQVRLAIQENLLMGNTILARFQTARATGYHAVEIRADMLDDVRIFEYAQAMDATGLPISGLFMGDTAGALSPDAEVRAAAIDRVRQGLTDAHDLQIPRVIVVPQAQHTPAVLTPEQEYTLLIWFVRVVNDLAGAMNTRLCLLPLQIDEARVLNTIAQTYAALAEMRFHPSVDMALDAATLAAQQEVVTHDLLNHIGILYVHDPLTRGAIWTPALENALMPFHQGWQGDLTVACGIPALIAAAPLATETLTRLGARLTTWAAE